MTSWHNQPLVERIVYYYQRVRAWSRRATVGGVTVRVVVWLTGAVGFLVAFPTPAGAVIGGVLALVAAGWPGSRWVTLLLLCTVGVVAVRLVTSAPDPSTGALVGLAGLLYLHHTAAALATQVRTDAVVPARVLGWWSGRAGLVLAASAGAALLLAGLSTPTWSATAYLLAGAVAAVGLVVLLLWARFRWLLQPTGEDQQPRPEQAQG